MRPFRLLATIAAILLAAGCTVNDEESTDDGDGTNARQFTVDVPDGATALRVDVMAEARAGEPDVTILVEDSAGANLATDTFSSADGTRSLVVNVSAQSQVRVTVRVVDGDAALEVTVTAIVPAQPEVIVLRETIVIVTTTTVTTTSPTTTTPTTTTSTPPTTTTPTPPTNATDNTTDNTSTNNSTNTTP